MDIYTGYVYLWYDTIARLFYLGGHQGKIEDSYICSSKPMKRAYKNRPHTFKMRVLEYVDGTTNDLRECEQKWLNKIKDEELLLTENVRNGTAKYYNVKKTSSGGSHKGHTKKRIKPSWNLGISKEMLEHRRNGLLCLFCDRLKAKRQKKEKIIKPRRVPKQSLNIKCIICNNAFTTKRQKQKCCSKKCAGKAVWMQGKGQPGFHKGQDAWNRGLKNPQAVINGRQSATKQSATVTGRKRKYREDGSWFWDYPKKMEEISPPHS